MQVCAVSHGGLLSPGGDQRLVKSIHVRSVDSAASCMQFCVNVIIYQRIFIMTLCQSIC